MAQSEVKIVVGEYSDGFTIVVDDEHYSFNQEDPPGEKLVKMFKDLGFKDVTYEECW